MGAPTPLSRSTLGTGARSAPVGTSRPIRPPSHVCIWLPGHWTRPAKANHVGAMRWKLALKAFVITFEGRITPSEN
jgi:hypothetical protein